MRFSTVEEEIGQSVNELTGLSPFVGAARQEGDNQCWVTPTVGSPWIDREGGTFCAGMVALTLVVLLQGTDIPAAYQRFKELVEILWVQFPGQVLSYGGVAPSILRVERPVRFDSTSNLLALEIVLDPFTVHMET